MFVVPREYLDGSAAAAKYTTPCAAPATVVFRRPRPVRPAAFDLGALAPELLLQIADHLTAADMVSLLRTCRDISALVAPHMLRLAARTRLSKAGNTVLHWASIHGHASLARALLQRGLSATAVNGAAWTALHHSVRHGHTAIARLLLAAGADVRAVCGGAPEDAGCTPLHFAGDAATALLLLRHGADVAASHAAGMTPLHRACRRGADAVVDVLLAHGAGLHARSRDSFGRSPLEYAIASGNVGTVKRLVALGLHLRAVGERGESPVRFAVAVGERSIARCLLEHGAQIDWREGEEMLDEWEGWGDCVELLWGDCVERL